MEENSFEEFNVHCDKIEEAIENRRTKYKRRFLVFFLFVILSFFLSVFLAVGVDVGDPSLNKDEYYGALLASIIIFLGMLRVTVLQFNRYKQEADQIGVGGLAFQKDFSLKEAIYSSFLSYFGEFNIKRTGNTSSHDLIKSDIIPDYDEYYSEDTVSGIYAKSSIEFSEVRLTRFVEKEPVDFFKGLVIIIDICDSRVKLRGNFEGKSVLIKDDLKHEDFVKEKFGAYNKFSLPTAGLEKKFEAYTTDSEEAEKLFSEKFISDVESLAELVQNSKEQIQHSEDKMMFAIEKTLSRMSDFVWWPIISFASKVSREKGKTKKLAGLHNIYDPTKHNLISNDVEAINDSIQVAAYQDKFVITIPYEHDLFEPNSLFEKPVIMEDKRLLFAIMTLISDTAEMLAEVKGSN